MLLFSLFEVSPSGNRKVGGETWKVGGTSSTENRKVDWKVAEKIGRFGLWNSEESTLGRKEQLEKIGRSRQNLEGCLHQDGLRDGPVARSSRRRSGGIFSVKWFGRP